MLDGIKMNKELLKTILLGHVVSGKVLSSDLNDGMMADTLLPGLQLEFKINLNGAVVNDANIKLVDVEASNGVIHVIDKVLLPPPGDSTKMSPMKNIVEVAISHGFKTLVSFLTKADLADILQGEGPFTVFAPNDEAFAKLPSHILEGIKTNKEHLKNVLLAHVVSGKMLSTDFIDGMTSNSLLENFNLLVTIDMNGLAVNGGKVILGDVEASNGVIHVIDEVILPMEDREVRYSWSRSEQKPLNRKRN
ncbi:UNVERIFIED_CONTAM: hypothetical protein GTU68_001583, partial [Idotea baltica]|nr:hypothetical protein [Idotea baltica]